MSQPRIATLLLLLWGMPLGCTDDLPAEISESGGSSGTAAASTGAVTQTATSSPETGIADGTSATAGTSGSDQSCCSPHGGAGCDEPSVADCVCGVEPECCAFEWSQGCVDIAEGQCGGCDPGPGSTTRGDTGTDTGPGEVCCDPLRTPGCAEDPGVEACVCAEDPFCCETAWDAQCVGAAEASCGVTCETGKAGECCGTSNVPGCNDAGIEACVCALDPYCCNNEWDGICMAEAQYECMAECGLPPPGGDCCMPHDGPQCDDAALSACVCMVDEGCCLFPWSLDCVATAVNQCGAACEGAFVPDPCCSPSMMTGCATPRIESCVCAADPFCCDDHWDGQCVTEAQTDCGAECYPPGTESCCAPHMTTGCDLSDVQACVCGMDPFCCNNEWDGQCVTEATDDCGGCMGGAGDCCLANGTAGCDDPAIEACVCASLPSCCGVEWSAPCVDEANLACMAMCAP